MSILTKAMIFKKQSFGSLFAKTTRENFIVYKKSPWGLDVLICFDQFQKCLASGEHQKGNHARNAHRHKFSEGDLQNRKQWGMTENKVELQADDETVGDDRIERSEKNVSASRYQKNGDEGRERSEGHVGQSHGAEKIGDETTQSQADDVIPPEKAEKHENFRNSELNRSVGDRAHGEGQGHIEGRDHRLADDCFDFHGHHLS